MLATIRRTPRRTTRGINRLKGSVADLLQPAILRLPDFLALSRCSPTLKTQLTVIKIGFSFIEFAHTLG